MKYEDVIYPSLSRIAKPLGLSLAKLASNDKILHSLKELEQYDPDKAKYPKKWKTWNKWGEWFLDFLMPKLGPAFPEIFRGRLLRHCPTEIIARLREEYVNRLLSNEGYDQDIQIEERDKKAAQYLEEASKFNSDDDWRGAEREQWNAVRLYYPYEPEWALYRYEIAQHRINGGELDTADTLINETQILRNEVLRRRGEPSHPYIQAWAESTHAWSSFLRGDNWNAIIHFENAEAFAREADDEGFIHRAIHMGVRSQVEPDILKAYFFPYLPQSELDTGFINRNIARLDEAGKLDQRGSLREGYNLWYKGALVCISKDIYEGKRVLENSRQQLVETDTSGFAAVSHAYLTQIHFDLLTTSKGDTVPYQNYEKKLLETFDHLHHTCYPYAVADLLITLAYCRMQYSDLSRNSDRRKTADYLCSALLIYPHQENILWQAGKCLLDKVICRFDETEKRKYKHSLEERIRRAERGFDYFVKWRFNETRIKTTLELIA